MNPQEQPTNATQPSTPQVPPTPTEPQPPKNNKTMLIIGIIVAVVIILGIIAFAMLGQNKEDSSKTNDNSGSTSNTSNPDSSKYQKYNVTDKTTGVAFSVSFYKDAKVEDKNGRTYLNSGEAGSMYSIYLGVATGDKIDCGKSPTTTMSLSGESTTVCYDSNSTQYAGYAKAKSGAVKINLAGQKAISIDEAKTIMESVKFN